MKPADRKLLARLVQASALAPADVERIVAMASVQGAKSLGSLLVEEGFVSTRDIARAQAELGGFEFVDILNATPDPAALALLDPGTCMRQLVMPLRIEGGTLVVAMADPADVYSCDAIARKVKLQLRTLVADREALREAIRNHYGTVDDTAGRMSAEDVQLVRFEAQREARTSQESIPRLAPESTSAARDASSVHEDPKPASDQFEAARPELVESLERSRLAIGMAQENTANQTSSSELDARTPVASLLRALFEDAFLNGAEAVQFTPNLHSIRLRARFQEGWRELTPYPSKYHDEVLRKLQRMAGLNADHGDLSVQRRFVLKLKQTEHVCVAQFDPTPHGSAAQVLLPENVPLLPDPLRSIGLPPEAVESVERGLTRQGGGLLLVSTPSARAAQRLHGSFVRRYGGGPREVISFERSAGRTFAGATQIFVPTAELQLAAIVNCAYMSPDLVILDSIENGTVLQAFAKLSMRGITAIGILTAKSTRAALACLAAAGLDSSTMMRSIAGLMHVYEAGLLCEKCRTVCDSASLSNIPEWALGMNVPFHEARGCDACGHTGRSGSAWIAELMVPDLNSGSGGPLATVVSRVAKLDELARAGRIDPRDCP